MLKTILVLEDEIERIEWLEENLPKSTNIIWCSDVDSFVHKKDELEEKGNLDLFILDYSLGRKLNGLDAVKDIDTGCAHVVIWSSHPKAYDMYLELKEKNVECFLKEFGRDSLLEKLLDLLQDD